MDKQHIIDEIRRTAEQNGGRALGRIRFERESGIGYNDWAGKYWARWSDALREAGYEPNKMQQAYAEGFLVEKLVEVIQETGRFPVRNELRLRSRNDPEFPNDSTFKRLGNKAQQAIKVITYCRTNGELDDVIEVCQPIVAKSKSVDVSVEQETPHPADGFVYLMKSGKYYKIGFTNSLDRRRYEIGMQLPEGIEPIHSIRTDDPSGIEAYWHHRFKKKRLKGEWFDLDRQEVAAFKKRKFM